VRHAVDQAHKTSDSGRPARNGSDPRASAVAVDAVARRAPDDANATALLSRRQSWGRSSSRLVANDDGAVVTARAGAGSEAAPVKSRADAFAGCYTAHRRELARLAYLLCGNAHQAEDVVAEACARVWPKYRRGRVDELLPYLRTAIVNEVRRRIRRTIIERRDTERQMIDLREGVRSDHSVEDRNILLPALATLPYEQRAVIVLRFYDDLTEDAIAEMLDVPAGTVKSRCARGLEQLRRLMGQSPDA
jgi:RNA polymerase sigma-70 factor (sigma-E family)